MASTTVDKLFDKENPDSWYYSTREEWLRENGGNFESPEAAEAGWGRYWSEYLEPMLSIFRGQDIPVFTLG